MGGGEFGGRGEFVKKLKRVNGVGGDGLLRQRQGEEKAEGEGGVGGGGEPAEKEMECGGRGGGANFAKDVADEERRRGGSAGFREQGPKGVIFRQVVFHLK